MHLSWYMLLLISGLVMLIATLLCILLRCALMGFRYKGFRKNHLSPDSQSQTVLTSSEHASCSNEPSKTTQTSGAGTAKTEATPLLDGLKLPAVNLPPSSRTVTANIDSTDDTQRVAAAYNLVLSPMRRQSSGLYNIGAIQPELYLRRGSVLTQASGSDYAVGVIRLRLSYDMGRSDFIVRILEVNVEPSDVGRCQVLVALHDGFDETACRSVEAVRSSGGFTFDQAVKFPIAIGDLVRRKLRLKILSLEPRKEYIGAVELDLLENDPSADIEVAAEVENRPDRVPETPMEHSYNGELELSLKYMISIKRLVVSLLRTKGIIMSKDVLSGDRCGVWAKVKLWQEDKVLKKKKTQAVRFSNPLVLNQAVSFTLSGLNVQSLVLEILLIEGHQWRLASSFLGRVVIGEHAPTPSGQLHWNSAILQGLESTMWHPLITWVQTPQRRYSQ